MDRKEGPGLMKKVPLFGTIRVLTVYLRAYCTHPCLLSEICKESGSFFPLVPLCKATNLF